MPSGTSAKEIAHYAQAVRYGTDCMYDYGRDGNIKRYGQPTPPVYDVTKIPDSVPISLFTGGNDILADPKDVTTLTQLLGKKVVHLNNRPEYTHMDFTWGILAKTEIYPDLIALLNKYQE